MTMADPTPGASPWVVLKFGGTSVSSVANWKNIAGGAARPAGRRPAARRRPFRPVRHHRSARAAAQPRPRQRMAAGHGADRAAPSRPGARPRRHSQPGARRTVQTSATDRCRHRAGRRSERAPARARDGARRIDGDAARRRVPDVARSRCAVGRCAHGHQGRAAAQRQHARELSVGDVRLRSRSGTAAALVDARHGLDLARLHRQRRERRYGAARARRLRYFGQLLRCEAAGASAGDLDRRARHVQRQSALGADGAAAARARIRRGAGNRQQRREGSASPLHHAGEAVRHSAVRLRDADAEARRHRHHHARRQRRGAGEGGHDQEEHHAHLDGDRRDVALGRLPRRRVRRCSRSTACRSISCRRRRPASPCRSIRLRTRSTRRRSMRWSPISASCAASK